MNKFAASLPVFALLLVSSSPAWAKEDPACAPALKAAQADKAAGKLGKAAKEAETCSQATCSKSTQKQCTDLGAAIADSQPTVIFSAKDPQGGALTSVKITVDGQVVATSLDGKAVALDPGAHTVDFEAEGAPILEKDISVEAGKKHQSVSTELEVKKAAPPASGDKPAAAAGAPTGDLVEDPTKRYYFIGLRYRGNVIPQFMLNMFVDGGATLFSNSFGIEADLRHDGFSLIPALMYTEYSTGDIVFMQKGKDATDPGNWSMANSGLKAIYGSADLLWSVRLANQWDFEYGAEFGLGIVFGSLVDNWVYPTNGGQVSPTNYTSCQTITQSLGCTPGDHQNATTYKVGGYNEPSWVNGGSKPNIFPLVNFPQIGLRYKPTPDFEARLGVGFSLTGFWFGLSGDYSVAAGSK